jgi:hypothetical protein
VETVSDMDGEVTALEAKLSKLREIKQGMMSELLGGEDQVGVSDTVRGRIILDWHASCITSNKKIGNDNEKNVHRRN